MTETTQSGKDIHNVPDHRFCAVNSANNVSILQEYDGTPESMFSKNHFGYLTRLCSTQERWTKGGLYHPSKPLAIRSFGDGPELGVFSYENDEFGKPKNEYQYSLDCSIEMTRAYYTPDAKYIVGYHEGVIRIWYADSGKEVLTHISSCSVESLFVTNDHVYFLTNKQCSRIAFSVIIDQSKLIEVMIENGVDIYAPEVVLPKLEVETIFVWKGDPSDPEIKCPIYSTPDSVYPRSISVTDDCDISDQALFVMENTGPNRDSTYVYAVITEDYANLHIVCVDVENKCLLNMDPLAALKSQFEGSTITFCGNYHAPKDSPYRDYVCLTCDQSEPMLYNTKTSVVFTLGTRDHDTIWWSSFSKDGRFLACIGDSTHLIVYDMEDAVKAHPEKSSYERHTATERVTQYNSTTVEPIMKFIPPNSSHMLAFDYQNNLTFHQDGHYVYRFQTCYAKELCRIKKAQICRFPEHDYLKNEEKNEWVKYDHSLRPIEGILRGLHTKMNLKLTRQKVNFPFVISIGEYLKQSYSYIDSVTGRKVHVSIRDDKSTVRERDTDEDKAKYFHLCSTEISDGVPQHVQETMQNPFDVMKKMNAAIREHISQTKKEDIEIQSSKCDEYLLIDILKVHKPIRKTNIVTIANTDGIILIRLSTRDDSSSYMCTVCFFTHDWEFRTVVNRRVGGLHVNSLMQFRMLPSAECNNEMKEGDIVDVASSTNYVFWDTGNGEEFFTRERIYEELSNDEKKNGVECGEVRCRSLPVFTLICRDKQKDGTFAGDIIFPYIRSKNRILESKTSNVLNLTTEIYSASQYVRKLVELENEGELVNLHSVLEHLKPLHVFERFGKNIRLHLSHRFDRIMIRDRVLKKPFYAPYSKERNMTKPDRLGLGKAKLPSNPGEHNEYYFVQIRTHNFDALQFWSFNALIKAIRSRPQLNEYVECYQSDEEPIFYFPGSKNILLHVGEGDSSVIEAVDSKPSRGHVDWYDNEGNRVTDAWKKMANSEDMSMYDKYIAVEYNDNNIVKVFCNGELQHTFRSESEEDCPLSAYIHYSASSKAYKIIETCTICCESPATMFYVPCGHQIVCRECHEELKKNSHETCSFCRTEINGASEFNIVSNEVIESRRIRKIRKAHRRTNKRR